jgi:MoxR-like ATPase
MRYLAEFDSGREHYLTCPGVPPNAAAIAPKSEPGSGSGQPSAGQSSEPGMPEPGASIPANVGQPTEPTTEPSSEPGSEPTEPEPIPQNGEPEPEPEPEPKRIPTANLPKLPEPVGSDHFMQARLDRYVKLRRNIMVVGPAGGGKTTGAGITAERAGLAYFEESMGPQTSKWDLVGYKSPDGRYVPGILREPYERGGVLVLDEIDASNPAVLTAINSAIANGHCSFPDAAVKRHPDFVLIACANTYGRGADRLYVGRQQLDAATLDRFVVIEWDYDERAELVWTGPGAREWVAYIQRIRKRAAELKMRFVVSPRASINGAVLLRAGEPANEVCDSVLWKGLPTDQRAELERAIAPFTAAMAAGLAKVRVS